MDHIRLTGRFLDKSRVVKSSKVRKGQLKKSKFKLKESLMIMNIMREKMILSKQLKNKPSLKNKLKKESRK